MQDLTFTGCIIAKNEEKWIKSAIQSLKALCTQVIVVDTGSIDNTPKIATVENCELYFKQWNNDFSEVRNYALSFARNEWVIFLDADEQVNAFEIIKYKPLFENKLIGGLSCIIRNYLNEEQTNYIEHRYTRIFRNRKNIRYKGSIHEQIAESIINEGFEIAESDIIIEHFGYIESSDEKKQRNRDLLLQELNRNPSDYLLFHIANTEFSMNNFIRAKEIFSGLLSSTELSFENIELAKLRLFQIALHLNDWKYIADRQNTRFSNKHYEGLKQFILSAYFMQKHQWEKARTALLAARNCNSSLVDANLVEKSLKALEILCFEI
jgi:glycosyltransferase involved in cell wall biosynthesis